VPVLFTFTRAEQVALDVIFEDRAETHALLVERLASVLDNLAQTCQGLVTTAAKADDLLTRLRVEFVHRMMGETAPWDDEDLREPVIDLLTRHLLAQARGGFVGRLLGAKQN